MIINIKDLIKNKKSKGIALVEVIAALGIAMVVITSLVSLSLFTVRSSLSTKLQLQGTKTATREAELLRAYRDSAEVSWEDFVSSLIFCNGSTESNICSMDCTVAGVNQESCTEGTGTEIVSRFFVATNTSGGQLQTSDNTVQVTITASWNVGGAQKSTHVYTDFSNWR